MCDIIKYLIKIDTSLLPTDFNQWKKIDLEKEKENPSLWLKSQNEYKNKNIKDDWLLLNNYKSIVIKSNKKNYSSFIIGGAKTNIEFGIDNTFYFLFFPQNKECYLLLETFTDYDIYFMDSDEKLSELKKLKELNYLHNFEFDKMNKIFYSDDYPINYSNDCWSMIMHNEVIGVRSPINNNKNPPKIDENEYYYQLKKYLQENSLTKFASKNPYVNIMPPDNEHIMEDTEIDLLISIIDEFVQNGIISIHKFI